MAITVDPVTNGDFTRIDRADATAGWTPSGQWAKFALNTTSQVENTGCMESTRVDPGVGIGTANFTSRSLENVHLRCWSKLAQNISSLATHGAQLNLGDENNYGCWKVYGSDRQVVVYNGWMMLVADPRKQFDGSTGGTIPTDILAITDAGIRVDFLDANGKALAVLDMLWEGNEVSIEGGTTGARGTFAEWSADDLSNGYGILREVGGIYYLNAGAVFQGVGTATSYFEDSNALIVFEDLPVSGSLYKLRHVGNATGTNYFALGSATGTGTGKEGAGGGVLRAAGDAPFRIEAIDTNVDTVGYYGVTMLGNDAAYDDQFRNVKTEDNSATSFTDITSNTNGGAGRTNPSLMPATEALNDATYYGHDERFYELNLNLAVAKGGTWTGTWEYYNGSTWASLTDVTDGTSNYATTGAQTVSYSIPDDWAKTTIDSDSRYWIRFRISSFTSSGTTPTMNATTGATCSMGGDIRLEDSAVEMISCSLLGMGSIRVRNGAFLKKTTIDAAVTPAKHAALDLGGSDPTADTVRDLVIQNCSKGVLLKGTGDVTYNFRNIKFSGNTNDVRVDFGVSDTVTINILDGGDAPTVDNVNGSTVNVVNAVTVRTEGLTEGAAVKIIANETVGTVTSGDTLSEGLAGSDGVYSYSQNYEGAFNPSGLDVIVRARNQGFPNAAIADDGGSLTDETTASNSTTLNDMTLLPATPVVNDAYYFGHNEEFGQVKLELSTVAIGTLNIVWEYWDGGAWSTLTKTDGTSNFTQSGTISWPIPNDWADTTVNGQGPYRYVRARLSAFVSILQVPKGRFCKLDVTRYLPFTQNRVITSDGLTVVATWIEDTISEF